VRQEGGIDPQGREAKFLKKSLRRHGVMEAIVTDRLTDTALR